MRTRTNQACGPACHQATHSMLYASLMARRATASWRPTPRGVHHGQSPEFGLESCQHRRLACRRWLDLRLVEPAPTTLLPMDPALAPCACQATRRRHSSPPVSSARCQARVNLLQGLLFQNANQSRATINTLAWRCLGQLRPSFSGSLRLTVADGVKNQSHAVF